MKKQNYKVLVAFKWRGHWREPDEQLELLDCEATALTNAKKIELVPTSKTATSKTALATEKKAE